MLIIEIHVDTIEDTEKSSSTTIKRVDERPTRADQKSNTTGNRFWNAIKVSFPGSLIPQNKKER